MTTEAPTATVPEPSLGELVAAATKDMSILIRSEIELAKLEMTAEAKKAAMGGGAFGGAAVFGLFGLIMGSFAAAYGLDTVLPTWAAFLIVTGLYLLFAAILGLVGLRAVKKLGPPERTVRTTKETIAALKNRDRKKNKNAAAAAG
jgi:hypothetical protein